MADQTQQFALTVPTSPSGFGSSQGASGLGDSVRGLFARMAFLQQYRDLAVGFAVMLILGILIVPLPEFLLDLMLAMSLAISILILMTSVYLKSVLEVSSFPTVLLITTIFRLGLNIASMRLILTEAQAGHIISAFGTFVVGGNYVVGTLMFIILLVINFIVIIKGSSRIAEVTARFTLDALPGKQMSIDADLNAGYIDEREARRRREDLSRESEFFGAMDGAAKFVKGDAIAGLVITAINILGGFAIGVFQKNMTVNNALSTYTILTIGDGLVSQIPALLVSVAAGLVITRSNSKEEIGAELTTQYTSSPNVLYVSSATLVIFGLLPGFPLIPFALLAGGAGALGYFRTQTLQRESEERLRVQLAEAEAEAKSEEKPVEDLLLVDAVEVELGYGLIPLVDETQGGDLFKRISNIRRQLAGELGIILPPVRVRDNLQLEPEEYVVKVRGNQVARNKLYLDMMLSMNPGTASGELSGLHVTEPVFGLPAVWVPSAERENAEIMGYTVVEPAAVITTHLTELLRRFSERTIDRQSVKQLVENLKKEYPALVDEISKEALPVGIVQKVLQNLLREGIPIRDLPLILEALLDYIPATKNVDVLTEYVRHSLSETIRRLYQDEHGVIHAIAIDPQLEEIMTNALSNSSAVVSPTLGLPNNILQSIQTTLTNSVDEISLSGYAPIVITAATVRPYFYRMIKTAFPTVSVISFTELPSDTEIEFIGSVRVE